MPASTLTKTRPQADGLPTWLLRLLATACGLIAANIYYAQPLAGPITAALGMPASAAGLVVTLTQLGYGAGLLLVVPLGDLLENKRLVLLLLSLTMLALLGAAWAAQPLPFLTAAFFIGVGSVAVQVLVPYAAHMAPEAVRGQVVGRVMSGLLLGIMLARPAASWVAQLASWHAVFWLSAGLMAVLTLALACTLPRRVPASTLAYGALLKSMLQLVRSTPILRRRALYQACLFAAFSLFWTATPLLLAGPGFHMSQGGIALFALAGVAGAIAAPLAGRWADRGLSRPATGWAISAVALAFLITGVGQPGSTLALGFLLAAAIVLDFGVAANLTIGQRAIFALSAQHRARLNGLYMTTFFLGGAIGSALGAWCFAHGGWGLTAGVGLVLPVAALLYYLTEKP